MRIFLVLICSLALAFAASGAQEQKKEKKPAPKKAAAPAAHVSQPKAKPVGKPTGAGKPTGVSRSAETHKAAGAGKPTGLGKPAKTGKVAGTGKPTGIGKPAETGKAPGAGKPAKAATATTAGKLTATGKATAKGKPFKAQHFNLPTKTTPTRVAAVNFQQGRHIQGSQNWQGSKYTVFRNYSSQWHDRNWWRGRYNRVVFVYGGWYAWNAGYWIPAWGYAPNAYYAYDGPIYGYNGLPPDQVTANVQSALQQQGYYHGEVDGLLGPLTRAAVADYQRDHGLYTTSTIDQPTLQSLGIA
jgi:hypothetical protein